jgi:hypothetical protein
MVNITLHDDPMYCYISLVTDTSTNYLYKPEYFRLANWILSDAKLRPIPLLSLDLEDRILQIPLTFPQHAALMKLSHCIYFDVLGDLGSYEQSQVWRYTPTFHRILSRTILRYYTNSISEYTF